MMWIFIMAAALLACLAEAVYTVGRFAKFSFVKKYTKGKKGLARILALLFLLPVLLLLYVALGLMNVIICILHLAVIWLICDLFRTLAGRMGKKKISYDMTGLTAILLTVLYLSMGFYLAHHVSVTSYTVETQKNVDNLRIVQFADSHVGTTFHADGFANYMEQINEEHPDVVVITGDFVDDYTTREDMLGCCAALGNLKTTYGVYFVYGNHDKGYYGDSYRGYGVGELTAELEKNGVTILEDESVLIADGYYLVGRQDLSEVQKGGSRADMETLMDGLEPDKFTIVLDHQPADYDAQVKARADLVLSGHTHGGQLIPITYAGEWLGANDKTYGYEKREDTNFIVTSGISDWAIKFKTGCKSEYVVIDIHS